MVDKLVCGPIFACFLILIASLAPGLIFTYASCRADKLFSSDHVVHQFLLSKIITRMLMDVTAYMHSQLSHLAIMSDDGIV